METPPEQWPDFERKQEVMEQVERWKYARSCGASADDAHSYCMDNLQITFEEWKEQEERATREAIG